MKSLAALLFAAFHAVAQVPEGDWDFFCGDGPTCIIKKESLQWLATQARRPCNLRNS